MTCNNQPPDLESYFSAFRQGIIGGQQTFESPFGQQRILYADWTASGRNYVPIESYLQQEIMPFIGNTHTADTITGRTMSDAYAIAKKTIKQHVQASAEDMLIFCGSGMTSAVNKLQRIIGFKTQQNFNQKLQTDCSSTKFEDHLKPIVFVTEMEHHSNHISWLETIADVEIIPCGKDGNVDLAFFQHLLEKYKCRQTKIAAITACSNVTGIQTPYHEVAKMIHRYHGHCFVDFASSAPYVNINMHPHETGTHLDAIYFSPHKFLGGPGTPGILIFNKKIATNKVPDRPGGGTVTYTNPWNEHHYVDDIEQREDGGTPPILQAIKAAMCIRLKERMGVENILQREKQMLAHTFNRLTRIKDLEILEGNVTNRLGIVSFIVKGAHHKLVVKMLNDRFGIQTRGGCSCAGTYGHKLLQIDKTESYRILGEIQAGNLKAKPGWIRLSLHPTMTNSEIDLIIDAIDETCTRFPAWQNDYHYDTTCDEYQFKELANMTSQLVEQWFEPKNWI